MNGQLRILYPNVKFIWLVNFYIQMDTAIWWSTSIHCSFVPSLVPRLPRTQNVQVRFLLTRSWRNHRVFGTERQRFVNFVHVENNCAWTPYVNIELWTLQYNLTEVDHSNSIVHLDIEVDHSNDCIYIWIYKLTIQMTAFTFGYRSWPFK